MKSLFAFFSAKAFIIIFRCFFFAAARPLLRPVCHDRPFNYLLLSNISDRVSQSGVDGLSPSARSRLKASSSLIHRLLRSGCGTTKCASRSRPRARQPHAAAPIAPDRERDGGRARDGEERGRRRARRSSEHKKLSARRKIMKLSAVIREQRSPRAGDEER